MPDNVYFEDENRALGQIITFSNSIAVIPYGENLMEFVFEAFISIKYIEGCNVCFKGIDKTFGDINEKECLQCSFKSGENSEPCQLSVKPGFKKIQIGTFQSQFGIIIIKTHPSFSENVFAALHNFVNNLGLSIENYFQKKRLEEYNNELLSHKKNLESQVKERTIKLKKKNEELKRFQNIVSSSTDMLGFLDKEYVYHTVNDAYVNAFDLDYDTIVGNNAEYVFGTDFFHSVIKPQVEICMQGQIVSYQEWFDFPKTGKCYMDVSYYPHYNNSQQIDGFIVNARNITEQKIAENKLLEAKTAVEDSEERLRFLFENTVQGFVYEDRSGEIIYANPAAERILGLSLGQMKGLTSIDPRWKAIHEDGTPWAGENHPIMETLKTGKLVNNAIQGVFNPSTNDYTWINVNSIPIFKDNEKLPYQAIATFEDITELKKAKELAEKSELKYKEQAKLLDLVFENTIDSIVLLDKDYNFIKVSNAYAQSCQKEVAEFFGNNHFDMYPSNLKDEFDEAKAKKEIYNKTARPFVFPDHPEWGTTYWDLGLVPVLDKESEIEFFIFTLKDVTPEIIAKQELIEAKRKAEESDNLKSEFINNMSHEIRTPMNGILGFANFLSNDSLDYETRKFYVSIIQNSGNQLLRIVDDILEISRLGTKQVEMFEDEVCLNKLLLGLFSIFDIKAKENKTPLYLNKGLPSYNSRILTDESKLNKILSNLLENALKFTKEGYIEFGYLLIDGEVQIYVKDTGIGICPDMQDMIFERFSQEEKEVSQKSGGLGLGLSIAKENAELLGGQILLKSEKGKGATFTLCLPYKPVVGNEQVVIEENEAYQVLIVEDEEINYLYLETLLMNEIDIHFIVYHAKNGEDAVKVCENHPKLNLVFMDIKMPTLNGIEATKQIKKINPDLPIIAQTAYTAKPDKDAALSAGCDDYISKPLDIAYLKSLITKHLNVSL